MAKIGFWKNVFRHKEKVAVDVGNKTELLTHTQSFRFSQIAGNRDAPPPATSCNPFEDEFYRLGDAALRLMISEDDVLAKGAAGDVGLYVDVAGQSGHWRIQDQNGTLGQSAVATIQSGLLRLGTRACDDLSRHGRAMVRALKLCGENGISRSRLDDATVADLLAWGPGDTQFFPLHPLTIDRDMVVLLPPL